MRPIGRWLACWAGLVVCVALLPLKVCADQYSPAYLELIEREPDAFNMLWKVPARSNRQRLALAVRLPSDTVTTGAMRSTFVGDAFIERSTITRVGGLVGQMIEIEGLQSLSTEVLVRIEALDGAVTVARLTPDSPSFEIVASPTTLDVATMYLVFGLEHIWQGVDHLLFVACLLFIARTPRRVLITITGFTLAHSVTLSLAALDVIAVPAAAVEATIALSIVFLAREIVLTRRDTLTWRYPIAVSASFGLLHGFGFASALGEIGLPQTEIPAALLAFNAGVELGQILFVLAVFAFLGLASWLLRAVNRSVSISWYWLEKPLAYSVGAVAMLWTLERAGGF